MRVKLVPEPPSRLGFVAEVQRALALVPGSEEDCCARIMDRAGIQSRDEAATWLTFLRALGLAREGPSGFSRVRRDPDSAFLAAAFRERVYGADEVLSILETADSPLTTPTVFERFESRVPIWERRKNPAGWRDVWRARVERLLGWAALLGMVERIDGGYRRVGTDQKPHRDGDRE